MTIAHCFFIILVSISISSFADLKAQNTAATASNHFGLELYKNLRTSPGTMFFSPFSIEVALAMTASGAQKETLAQMRKTLFLTKVQGADFKSLLNQLKSSPDYKLAVANRLWGQSGTPFSASFLNELRLNYDADLKDLDFMTNPEGARTEINRWVEAQTQERIKNLLMPGSISKQTDLVLTNAIYFKGQWAKAFESKATRPADFFLTPQQSKRTDFMHQSATYRYTENQDLQFLQIPYTGGDLVIEFILPQPKLPLSKLEKKLTLHNLTKWANSAYEQHLDVAIPKFKTEYQISLEKTLARMGMPLAFDPAHANFSGMRALTQDKNLYISKVIHKAFIEVNEEGTEAAAATAVIAKVTTAMPMEPKAFTANRPFLYLIRHLKTGTILFLGRYAGPSLDF